MEKSSKLILNQALELPANERAILAEQLLMSLDLPDSKIDEQWAKEAENRINEYEKGNIETRSAQEVFGKYKK
jgi:putative addiction module component (TIGR02574 family)